MCLNTISWATLRVNLLRVVLIFFLGLCAYAKDPDKDKIISLAPSVLSPKQFVFDFSYLLDKRIERFDYDYSAYVKVFVLQEPYKRDKELFGAGIGVKFGVMLPTYVNLFDHPISLDVSLGMGKTVLHHRPWLGKKDQALERKDMAIASLGLVYFLPNGFLLKAMYSQNTVSYIDQDWAFHVGYLF